MQQHQIAAQAGRKIQVVRRDDDRQARARVQLAEESSGSRAGRRDRATLSARREGECSGAFWRASAPAMTTRCFSPPDSVLNSRDCEMSACPSRATRRARSRDPRALRSRTRQGADSGPSSPFRAPCTRTRAASPAAPSPCAARQSRAESCAGRRRRAGRARSRGAAARRAIEATSSCRSRWAENADEAAARHARAHVVEHGGSPRRYENETCSAASPGSLIEHQIFGDASAVGGASQRAHAQRMRECVAGRDDGVVFASLAARDRRRARRTRRADPRRGRGRETTRRACSSAPSRFARACPTRENSR